MGPDRAASARWIDCAISTEPVKATPATRGSATSAAPTVADPGTEMQRGQRHAGLVQQRDRTRRDQGRLLGGLRDDRVAGR